MLSESEIRPDELMRTQAEKYAEDVRWLLARKREFVTVSCPACGGDRSQREFEKYKLSYRRCSTCRTVYVSPRPSLALLEEYYANSQNYAYWTERVFPASEAARREKIFVPRVERLLEICKRLGVGLDCLLEVGAGFGIFCDEVVRRRAFARTIAVEPTPGLARRCRSRGLEVIEQPIAKVDLGAATVDVMASFEVIEHLFSPREFLEQSQRLLTPGRGILVLTCPNVDGFDVGLLGARSSTFDTQHLNYFHPGSLSGLLASVGFEVLEVQTPGELDAELVRKAILSGEYTTDLPFLRKVLIDEWPRLGQPFQEFLSRNLLSSHMWVAARRRA